MDTCSNTKYRNEIMSQKWGKLTVLSFAGHATKHRRTLWNCRCDCGNELVVRSDCLRSKTESGGTKSCGKCVRTQTGENARSWKGCGGLSASRWQRIVADAERRKIPISISIGDAWNVLREQNGRCAITGSVIALPSRTKGEKATASLDRIDSSKGYEPGNIWWVHKRINWMKSDMSMDEFVSFCQSVVAKWAA